MKRKLLWLGLTAACLGLVLAGCGKKDAAAEHKQSESEEGEDGGVTFKEGRGLWLNPEVIKALGLRTAEAEERPLADNIRLIAQVFETSPRVLASATVPAAEAAHFQRHAFQGAELVRVDRSTEFATRLVDLIVALDRTDTPAIGDFVEVVFAAKPTIVLAVPSSALLEAAAGTFVYVVNGEHFLRTAVKIEARTADFVEITDGLYVGDAIVTAPVEQLWLAELRLTKGGGHSH